MVSPSPCVRLYTRRAGTPPCSSTDRQARPRRPFANQRGIKSYCALMGNTAGGPTWVCLKRAGNNLEIFHHFFNFQIKTQSHFPYVQSIESQLKPYKMSRTFTLCLITKIKSSLGYLTVDGGFLPHGKRKS